MTSRTISAYDSDGELVWFYADCAKGWSPNHFDDGPLYFQGGNWVLMPGPLGIVTSPEGKVVEPKIALAWLIRNEYELPEEILPEADERRI